MSRLLICIVLGLAAATAVHAAGARLVAPEQVCAAARELVVKAASRPGLDVAVECPHARAVEVAPGALAWTLEPGRAPIVAGPSRAVLQLSVNGGRASMVSVPLTLTLSSKAWVASRSAGAGEWLGAGDLELRTVHWPIGMAPAVAGDAAPSGRARLGIKAGEPVAQAQLMPANEKLQGDAVRVALRSGAITLEAPGVLVGNAQIGRPARIQLKGRHDTLQGVLVDASTVIVEP